MFRTDPFHTLDDISGTDAEGMILTDTEVLDRVSTDGSLALTRGPADRLRRSDWLDDFAALADLRGMQVSLRDTGRVVLVLDVNWTGWAPPTDDDYTTAPSARSAHPSRARGPRPVPER